MKLNSGREVPNKVIRDMIDYVATDTIALGNEENIEESLEELSDSIVNDRWGEELPDDLSDSEAEELVDVVVRQGAAEFAQALNKVHGELYISIVVTKYPD